MSKKIIVSISEDGCLRAETCGMQGTECITELDRLMKGLTRNASLKKKPEFFKEKIILDSTIKVRNDD